MTYNTPELLSVGAAQNLVLGHSDFKESGATNYDDEELIYDNTLRLDGTAW